MTYLAMTLMGLASFALCAGFAAYYVWQTPQKIAACVSLGGAAFGATGFLLSLAGLGGSVLWPLAVGTIVTILTVLGSWKEVPPGAVQVFQPSIFRLYPDDVFAIEECQVVAPGNQFIWSSTVKLVATIPFGRIILDGAKNSELGIIDVRFGEGSTGKVPFRVEATPLFSDLSALGRFIEAGTASGAGIDNNEERLNVMFRRLRSVILGPIETASASMLPHKVTRDAIQSSLERPLGNQNRSTLEIVREEAYDLGLDPESVVLRIGDIVFSDETKKTLATSADNAMIARTQQTIYEALAPKSAEARRAELLADQKEALAKAKGESSPAAPNETKEKLLARQRKAIKRKLAPLEAQLKGLPTVEAYARAVAGQKDAANREARNLASRQKLEGEIALLKADEADEDLLDEFLDEYRREEENRKKREAEIQDLERACAAERLTGAFRQKLEEYEALLREISRRAYSLAQAGEDASFITIAGLEGVGATGIDGINHILRATEGRFPTGSRKGGS